MAGAEKTIGESLFEKYLDAMRYPYEFEKEYEGKNTKPDYTVSKNGIYLFEVKDFDEFMPLGIAAYDPYPRIREKIGQGRVQFKEFKEFPCSIVLRNNGNTFVHLEDPNIVLGAMYGDSGYTFPVKMDAGMSSEPPKRTFIGGGKMLLAGEARNTTISALITLRHVAVGQNLLTKVWKEFPDLDFDGAIEETGKRYPHFDLGERQLGVIVWENTVARIPLPRNLFNGPCDERWGAEENYQHIVFRGEKLPEIGKG
jgi:hypothetical protein